jgi:hypothetical protein
MVDMKDLSRLSDAELFHSLEALARSERRCLPAILSHLGELDSRDASPPKGASLFAYCLKVLRWSEGETWRRIRAARASKRYRKVRLYLGSGRLTLSAVAALEPHLTLENHRELLGRVQDMSSRDLDAYLATLSSKPERRETIKPLGPRTATAVRSMQLPSASDSLFAPGQAMPAETPGPSRVEYVFTVDEALAREAEDARALLRNKYPFCRLEDVFREAVSALLDRLDPARRPRRPSRPLKADAAERRRVPTSVRAIVWTRDGGRCVFTGPDGLRCRSRAFLQVDHIRPFAMGGPSDDPANLRLLCRSHNIHMSRRVFGFI